ncbi:hypothetical protein PF010_g10764 [Phytophthora fragariae]|uniref:Uncharacterized protein n=1 Tax=Phytophthora fragariae TaxID=53985 RepID=A0A6A3L0A2_9STRA|nr:hypothetical protein PF011_g9432 [Phytophthora fragariae]KAE9111555.1 hypothetical protein PF010_g10764 [Phytophthora fragariae]KAE9231356.1 hypothetical protein PF004_g10245 [Phytophthora fragariae]
MRLRFALKVDTTRWISTGWLWGGLLALCRTCSTAAVVSRCRYRFCSMATVVGRRRC